LLARVRLLARRSLALRPFVRHEQAEESATIEEAERRLVEKAARFVNEETARLGVRRNIRRSCKL
jgi:hypothetical protein